MATGIFCTVAEVQRKVGAGASATSNVEAFIDDYTTQIESMINAISRYNWSDAYAGLDVDVKGILKMVASSWAAMMVIQYDMGGYTNVREAENMINLLSENVQFGLSILKEQAVKDFIVKGS